MVSRRVDERSLKINLPSQIVASQFLVQGRIKSVHSPSRWEVESIDHVQIIQTLVIFGAPRKQINVVSMLQKNGDIVMRIVKERNEENKNDDAQQLR